jgi:hypothetical protein
MAGFEIRSSWDGGGRRFGGRKVKVGLIALGLVGIQAVPVAAIAAKTGHFTADQLDGAHEVPVRSTVAHGNAKFALNDDGSMTYHLEVARISNVTQAHIHVVTNGQDPQTTTGGIVVWLFPSPTARTSLPGGGGPTNGRLASGTFTAADFVGSLAQHPMEDLLAAIAAGRAYVNVHTNDGVPPTDTGPGDFPGGEIRHNLHVQGPGNGGGNP